jgi:hypothetical protein
VTFYDVRGRTRLPFDWGVTGVPEVVFVFLRTIAHAGSP